MERNNLGTARVGKRETSQANGRRADGGIKMIEQTHEDFFEILKRTFDNEDPKGTIHFTQKCGCSTWIERFWNWDRKPNEVYFYTKAGGCPCQKHRCEMNKEIVNEIKRKCLHKENMTKDVAKKIKEICTIELRKLECQKGDQDD